MYGAKKVFKLLGLLVLVAFLALFFLGLGLVLGYGVVGDGSEPLSILSPDKWASLIEKFTGQ